MTLDVHERARPRYERSTSPAPRRRLSSPDCRIGWPLTKTCSIPEGVAFPVSFVAIPNVMPIKDDDVGRRSLFEPPPIGQAKPLRGSPGHLVHGRLERQGSSLARFSQKPRKRSEGRWVLVTSKLRPRVGGENRCRMLHESTEVPASLGKSPRATTRRPSSRTDPRRAAPPVPSTIRPSRRSVR